VAAHRDIGALALPSGERDPANAVAGGDSGDEETLVLVDGFKAGCQSEPDFVIETAADANERRAKSNGISRPSVPAELPLLALQPSAR
jgi:hypothetical protein